MTEKTTQKHKVVKTAVSVRSVRLANSQLTNSADEMAVHHPVTGRWFTPAAESFSTEDLQRAGNAAFTVVYSTKR